MTQDTKQEREKMQTKKMIVIGCVSKKQRLGAGETVPAADLYTSALWAKRRAHAERSGAPWLILSAEHGLIHPAQPLALYNTTISAVRKLQREAPSAWHTGAAAALDALELADGETLELEVYAGAAYVERLKEAATLSARAERVRVVNALEGMQIGQRLRWYNEQAAAAARTNTDAELETAEETAAAPAPAEAPAAELETAPRALPEDTGPARPRHGFRRLADGQRVGFDVWGLALERRGDVLAVTAPYSGDFIARAKSLGGRWSAADRAWMFEERHHVRVQEIVAEVYGWSLGAPQALRTVDLLLEWPGLESEIWAGSRGHGELVMCGRTLIRQKTRDGGPVFSEGVSVYAGRFARRGGSRANPALNPDAGTAILIEGVPAPVALTFRAELIPRAVSSLHIWTAEQAAPFDMDAAVSAAAEFSAELADAAAEDDDLARAELELAEDALDQLGDVQAELADARAELDRYALVYARNLAELERVQAELVKAQHEAREERERGDRLAAALSAAEARQYSAEHKLAGQTDALQLWQKQANLMQTERDSVVAMLAGVRVGQLGESEKAAVAAVRSDATCGTVQRHGALLRALKSAADHAETLRADLARTTEHGAELARELEDTRAELADAQAALGARDERQRLLGARAELDVAAARSELAAAGAMAGRINASAKERNGEAAAERGVAERQSEEAAAELADAARGRLAELLEGDASVVTPWPNMIATMTTERQARLLFTALADAGLVCNQDGRRVEMWFRHGQEQAEETLARKIMERRRVESMQEAARGDVKPRPRQAALPGTSLQSDMWGDS